MLDICRKRFLRRNLGVATIVEWRFLSRKMLKLRPSELLSLSFMQPAGIYARGRAVPGNGQPIAFCPYFGIAVGHGQLGARKNAFNLGLACKVYTPKA